MRLSDGIGLCCREFSESFLCEKNLLAIFMNKDVYTLLFKNALKPSREADLVDNKRWMDIYDLVMELWIQTT